MECGPWEDRPKPRQDTSRNEVMPMTEPLLLLAVDIDLSPATHAMLLTAKSFLVQLAPQSQALLLTVIPVPYDTPSSLGRFRGQAPCLSATTVQRTQARHTVQLAQAMLVQGGIAALHSDTASDGSC